MTFEQVLQRLVDAAEKLGYEAARLWPQMVAITWFKAIAAIAMWSLLVPLLLGVGVWLIRKAHRAEAEARAQDRFRSGAGDIYQIPGFVFLVYAGVAVLVGILSIPDVGADLLYPEARTVLRMVGK